MLNVKRFRKRRPPEEGIPQIIPCGEPSRRKRQTSTAFSLDDDEVNKQMIPSSARGEEIASALQNHQSKKNRPSNQENSTAMHKIAMDDKSPIPASSSSFWSELEGDNAPSRPPTSIMTSSLRTEAQTPQITSSPTAYKSSFFRNKMGQRVGK